MERFLLTPLLQSRHDQSADSLSVEGGSISLSEASTSNGVEVLFANISKLIEYLAANLPTPIACKVPLLLGPNLISMIISLWLSPAIPTDLDSMEEFQNIVVSVLHFADAMERQKWPGRARLVNWTKETPRLWLDRRQEVALDKIRRMLASGFGDINTVERVETQVMSKTEDIFTSRAEDDDWNAEWSDDDEARQPGATDSTITNEENTEADVSAWGLGEEANAENVNVASQMVHNENEDSGAWGWGDEDEDGQATLSPTASPKRLKRNGIKLPAPTTEREITLRETYNITALPGEVLELITQALSDAETLKKPT